MGIIQLNNVDGRPLGLYQFAESQLPAAAAVAKIEMMFDVYRDYDDPQGFADAALERRGIVRVHAEEASTDVL